MSALRSWPNAARTEAGTFSHALPARDQTVVELDPEEREAASSHNWCSRHGMAWYFFETFDVH
jgi:hypothetical protein